MIVVFDSSVLIDLLNEKISGDNRAKLDGLVSTLTKSKSIILVPTPVLTELMIYAGAAREKYYSLLAKSSVFQLAAFDSKAAMECSLMLNKAFTSGEKRQISKTKFKFDWQIASIAASRKAEVIYSEDVDLERCAKRLGIGFQKPSDLPLPDFARQHALDLEGRNSAPFNEQ